LGDKSGEQIKSQRATYTHALLSAEGEISQYWKKTGELEALTLCRAKRGDKSEQRKEGSEREKGAHRLSGQRGREVRTAKRNETSELGHSRSSERSRREVRTAKESERARGTHSLWNAERRAKIKASERAMRI
jgi:hypothetical protein